MVIRPLVLWFVVLCCCGSYGYKEERPFKELSKRFCRVYKQCERYEAKDYTYNNLSKISNIPNSQQEGYLVRFSFYVMGERDAYIIFTTSDKPNWNTDSAYEITIGGWNNQNTLIRRKRLSDEKTSATTPDVLTRRAPLKVLVSITTDGEIQVFIEHSRDPIAVWKDPQPLPIQYFGFASYDNLVQFYYNCENDEPQTYGITELQTSCDMYKTHTYEYKDFIPIPSNQPEGYRLSFLTYIKGRRDAHILLTEKTDTNTLDFDDLYEILIGGWSNTRVLIRRKKSAAVLVDIPYSAVFHEETILPVLVRLANNGELSVYAKYGHTQFQLLASVIDAQPLPVRYISFASYDSGRLQFFYQCSLPPPPFDGVSNSAKTHPLLNDPEVPPGVDKRNLLTTECSYYFTEKYEYKNFTKLTDLPNSSPKGYILQVPLYVQGIRDLLVQFSLETDPAPNADIYEFLLGGWGNSRLIIRRKRGYEPLNDFNITNAISETKPTKFVLEVTNGGHIRVFSEANKAEPIATAFDPNPLEVKYMSFATYPVSRAEFFYNCRL